MFIDTNEVILYIQWVFYIMYNVVVYICSAIHVTYASYMHIIYKWTINILGVVMVQRCRSAAVQCEEVQQWRGAAVQRVGGGDDVEPVIWMSSLFVINPHDYKYNNLQKREKS